MLNKLSNVLLLFLFTFVINKYVLRNNLRLGEFDGPHCNLLKDQDSIGDS